MSIFEIIFLNISMTNVFRKKILWAHRTALWASSSRAGVSLESFALTSVRLSSGPDLYFFLNLNAQPSVRHVLNLVLSQNLTITCSINQSIMVCVYFPSIVLLTAYCTSWANARVKLQSQVHFGSGHDLTCRNFTCPVLSFLHLNSHDLNSLDLTCLTWPLLT